MAPSLGLRSPGVHSRPEGQLAPPLHAPCTCTWLSLLRVSSECAWTWGHAKVMGTRPVKLIPASCPQAPG